MQPALIRNTFNLATVVSGAMAYRCVLNGDGPVWLAYWITSTSYLATLALAWHERVKDQRKRDGLR